MNDPTSSEGNFQLPPRRKGRKRRRNVRGVNSATRFSAACVEFLQRVRLTIGEQATERSSGWFAFVLVLTVSLGMDAMFRSGFVPGLFNGLSYLNFVVHELGHLACKFAPRWIHVAAGTFVQLALPAGAVVMFLRQRDAAASCFALCWLSVSLMHSADYIADARAMDGDMTLSAGFWSLTSGRPVRPDELGHDWNFMLGELGLLKWDTTLAACVRILAGTFAAIAVLTNGYMLWVSIRGRRSSQLRY